MARVLFPEADSGAVASPAFGGKKIMFITQGSTGRGGNRGPFSLAHLSHTVRRRAGERGWI